MTEAPARWYAVVFKLNSSAPLCEGEGTTLYKAEAPQRTERTVDWIIGDTCGGLEPGMRFMVTYTPLTPRFSGSFYEGVVVAASQKRGPLDEHN